MDQANPTEKLALFTEPHWRFSLATLFRATSLVAMALGWLSLVSTVRPQFVMTTIIAITAPLAAVVGWRRNGARVMRFKAAFLFFSGGILASCYSDFAAQLVQSSTSVQSHPWETLDQLFLMIAVVLAFPIQLIVLVLMFRAWTWSAHDSSDL